MQIELDNLSRPEVHALLCEHLQSMFELSPPESVHALDIEKLRRPEITFWCAWEGSELLGCGALKELNANEGEVKSMCTAKAHLRKGVARSILTKIIQEAEGRSYERLWLETGSAAAFKPAQRLYLSFGFSHCPPFGEYVEDPHSVFMTKLL
jgi:putative acetyltransferase